MSILCGGTLRPESIEAGTTTTIEVTPRICNDGDSAEEFVQDVRIGSLDIFHSFSVGTLNPGECVTTNEEFSALIDTPGEYEVQVIDGEGVVDERGTCGTLTVTEPTGGDVTVECAGDIIPGELTQDQLPATVEVPVRVTNNTDFTQIPKVRVELEGTLFFNDEELTSVPSGGSVVDNISLQVNNLNTQDYDAKISLQDTRTPAF